MNWQANKKGGGHDGQQYCQEIKHGCNNCHCEGIGMRSIFMAGKVLLFLVVAAHADICVADYRSTPSSKLAAAKAYVELFLEEDKKLDLFWKRDMAFPMPADEPYLDCDMQSVVKKMRVDEPIFENASQQVVLVPVVAELLMVVDAAKDGGPEDRSTRGSKCSFEYQRYSATRNAFERVEGFGTRVHQEEFLDWGQVYQEDIDRTGRYIAIDPAKGLIRFFLRVSVRQAYPYRLPRQVPRHIFLPQAIEKLRSSITFLDEHLLKGVSDRDAQASGEILIKDLRRMEYQNRRNKWALDFLVKKNSVADETISIEGTGK